MMYSLRYLACAFVLATSVHAGAMAADGNTPPAPGSPGTFFGSMSLSDCDQADALLRLGADRRYTLQAHCRATLEDLPLEQGDWSADGTCVRLAPDGFAMPRQFAAPADDVLVLADGSCIDPVEDPRGRILHRALPGRTAEAD